MMKRVNIFNGFWVTALCLAVLCGCGSGGQRGTILIGGEAISDAEGSREENIPKEDTRKEEIRKEGSGGDAGAVVSETPEGSGTEEGTVIRVYVCGAVIKPGVVSVPAGSRAEDALLAAGGFREDAGREAVNLADWIQDGQMLYFPTEEEAWERAGEPAAGGEITGLVNINTADAAQLCTLPGIGESRAADIIAYREKSGGFGSCEDIMQVPGIKTSVYEKIVDKITVK